MNLASRCFRLLLSSQAAKGGVLFVDEAYELGKGPFGAEASTAIVAAMTDPKYRGGAARRSVRRFNRRRHHHGWISGGHEQDAGHEPWAEVALYPLLRV